MNAHSKRCRTFAVATGILLLATGCSPTNASVHSRPQHPAVAQADVLDAGHADQDSELHVQNPVLDAAAQATAITAAAAAVTAYARPQAAKSDWLRSLSPFLTLSAALAYKTVNPAKIPAHAVLSGSALEPGSSGTIANVDVPTDAGSYLVVLQRQPDDSWLVETITAAR